MIDLITNTIRVLENNNTILYPTDTVWGLGCDATSENAVKKIYELKKRSESKSLVLLVSSINMLKKYVSVPQKALELLKSTTQPTTIIYSSPKGIASNAISKEDNTVAIRIVQNDFCRKLIKRFGKPIVSTSANISGKVTPESFSGISKEIKSNVDFIVEVEEESKKTKPSTILKIMEDGSIKTLRV